MLVCNTRLHANAGAPSLAERNCARRIQRGEAASNMIMVLGQSGLPFGLMLLRFKTPRAWATDPLLNLWASVTARVRARLHSLHYQLTLGMLRTFFAYPPHQTSSQRHLSS
jgi:hypothetical protein